MKLCLTQGTGVITYLGSKQVSGKLSLARLLGLKLKWEVEGQWLSVLSVMKKMSPFSNTNISDFPVFTCARNKGH